MAAHRQFREEGSHLHFSHFLRVALAVHDDEALDPTEVCLFGTRAVGEPTHTLAHAIEQAGRVRCPRAISQPYILFPRCA